MRNPKGIGLVLSGLARRAASRGVAETQIGGPLVAWLSKARSRESAGWGYPFAWQSRAFFAPRGTPNAVCSAFVVAGLLDWSEATGDVDASRLAEGTFPFWVAELRRTGARSGICFSYTPLDTSCIHNVNLMVAATLLRLAQRTDEREGTDLARAAAQFTIAAQRPDGSWPYGEGSRQQWIDGFHTGFNLGALGVLAAGLKDDAVRAARRAGYEYFRSHLLDARGRPLYYADHAYPVDIHAVAQAILTVLGCLDLDPEALARAEVIASKARQLLRLEEGVYAYQRRRFYRNRIVYARWGQAWMFRALAELEWALDSARARLQPKTGQRFEVNT